MEKYSNAPVLSICIPTYNRKVLLKEILDELLLYPNNDIEIIIIDNASTDGTRELLDSYSDPRLQVKFNRKNIGMFGNQVLAVFSGTGKYTLSLMDRDKLDSGRLIDITKRLHQLDAPLILLDYEGKKEFSVYGGIALSTVILRTHPSYLIYNTKSLHKTVGINELYKTISNDIQTPYPYTGVIGMYLLAECSRIAVLPNKNAITLEIKKVPSYSQYGFKHKTIYYEPEGAIKRYKKYIDILKKKYSPKAYKKYMPYIYTAEFFRGVLLHYGNSHDRYRAKKYNVKKKEIGDYNLFYLKLLKQSVNFMIIHKCFSIRNLIIINVISWCILCKVYFKEKPYLKCGQIVKISDKILSKWIYTIYG